MGEDGIKPIAHIFNMIYDSGEWPEDFLNTVMIPIEKKTNAVRCEDHRTISLISHASKVMLKIINRRLQRRAEECVSINQFGLRKGVGTREAITIIRMISERSIDI